jgi:hypothetical protein
MQYAPALAAQGDCGQPVTTGANPAASDCLFILRVAVGSETCSPTCICDTNGSGSVTASDALVCLSKAVGQDVALECACTTSCTSGFEGVFFVLPPAGLLVPGATGLLLDALVLAGTAPPTVSIESGCETTAGTLVDGSLTVAFGDACDGVEVASLEATFDEACDDILTGTFTADGATTPFTARRVGDAPIATLGTPPLTPDVDSERSSSLVIGPQGGEITARAYDGTRYRLVVPAGALAAPTQITLTPVWSVDGLPLTGGLHGAVELSPSGLILAEPALLIISPATSDAGLTTGFGWSGAENSFGVAAGLRSPDSTRTSFRITHFSGYGVALPGPSELDGLYADLAALVAEEYEAREGWAEALALYLEDATSIHAFFVQWFDQLVAPLVAKADESPRDAILAHHAFENWLIWVSFFFTGYLDPALPAELRTRWTSATNATLTLLASYFDDYTRPRCSATVPEWKDWLRVPEELRLAQLRFITGEFLQILEFFFQLSPERYCVALELRETSFPTSLDENTTTMPLSFSTVIALPDGTDLPVPGQVALVYSDGLSGDASLATSAGGEFSTVIDRDPLGPLRATVEVDVTETDAGRPDVLRVRDRFTAGTLDVYFAENLTPGPRPILSLNENVEACVYVAVGEPVGRTVDFVLFGEGTLSATSAITTDALGVGKACVTYTSPLGYVPRGVTFDLEARVEHEGDILVDVLRLHPLWVDLQLVTDVGLGHTNATNQGFAVENDGPFPVEVHVLIAGATTEDDPSPLADGGLVISAADDILQSGAGYDSVLATQTDARGIARFSVGLAGSGASSHTIEVRTDELPGGEEIAAGAFVSFYRAWALPSLYAEMPSSLPGNGKVPLVVEAQADDGTPVSGLHVDLTVTGGILDRRAGSTTLKTNVRLEPDSDQVSVGVTLRNRPGGEVYDSTTVGGVRGPVGKAGLGGRREVASTTGGPPGGPIVGDGMVNACMPGNNPANCIHGGYGEVSYSAVVAASASVFQDLVGSSETGLLSALAETAWASSDFGSAIADAQMLINVQGGGLPSRLTFGCSGGGGESHIATVAGNTVTFHAYISGQPDPGFTPFPGQDVEFRWGGGQMTYDLYMAAGKSYRITLKNSSVAGECFYDLQLGDDVVYDD